MPDTKPARRKAWKGRLGDSEMKIEKLPSGNYRIRVVVGHDANGKPVRKSFTHYDKTRLRRIAAEYADEHRNVTTLQKVSTAIDAFLDAKTPVLSPSTLRAYTSMSRTLKREHGAFCALPVASVSQRDMQRLINALVAKGNSPKTVRNFHGFLSAVFDYSGNRLPRVTLPQKQPPNIHIPDEEMVSRILASSKGTRLEIPLALATFGLRRSEICALSVSDLDGNMLHIHSALVYNADNELKEKLTKNYSSDRYVRIPDDIADKIRQAGMITDYTPEGISKAYNRLLKKNGFPHYRLHDLRHFLVSYCHNVLHLSDAQIQSITGHKTNVVMRNNYLHSMNDDEAGALVAEKLSGFMA